MNGLRRVRKQCNMTIQEVADKLNVSKQTISAWENGTKIIPNSRKKQLSLLFGVSEKDLDTSKEKTSVTTFLVDDQLIEMEYLSSDKSKDRLEERTSAYIYFEKIRNEKEKQKSIEKSIHSHFSCNEVLPIEDQFHFIERANALYGHFDNVVKLLYQAESEEWQHYNDRIQELLDTMESEMSKCKTKRTSKKMSDLKPGRVRNNEKL